MLLLLVLLSSAVVTSHGQCGSAQPEVISESRKQTDGSVIVEDGTRYPAGCVWESRSADNSTILLGCSAKVTCLWECCPQGHLLNTTNKCIQDVTKPDIPQTRFNVSIFRIVRGNPCLGFRFKIGENEISRIQEDGVLVEKQLQRGKEVQYPAGSFCLGTGTNNRTVALVCDPGDDTDPTQDEERRDATTFVIYTVARIIALPFLIATVLVYSVIPELRNLHGKCLVSHVTSLSMAYICLIVITLGRGGLTAWFCVTSALFLYFFLLGSFFWLNVMCFDIWWTFSGHRRAVGNRETGDQRKFLLYSLYAWGCPVFMLCISMILEFTPQVPDSYIKPEFGTKKCWFKDKITVLAYFSGPVAVLILCNIVFFVITAVSILRTKKQTSVLSTNENRRIDNQRNNERRFVLYVKLFLVMGVTWSLDLAGWAIGGPDYIWWVTDVASILQGVLIFLIFVWKARIRRLLRQRFNRQSQSSQPTTGITLVQGSG